MKDFIKMTLAVICGLFIMGILGFFLFFGFIGAIASLGSGTPVIPRSGVLLMDFSKTVISEQSEEMNPMTLLQGDNSGTTGLLDAVRAINKAAGDPAVTYIFMKPEGLSAGIAQVEELHQALLNFRKSGKAVVAYIENPTTGAYYLASAADKIYMGSYVGGSNMMTGVGTQMIFLKDLLDKFGVNVQLIRHGKYKSAGEMFIRNTPSEDNLEQYQVMINTIWTNLAVRICENRGISRKRLDDLIDNLKLSTPQDFMENGLVDGLLTKEELKEKLADFAVKESYNDVQFIKMEDYIAAMAEASPAAGDKIAIIYAEGDIIDGYDKQQVAGDRFASVIAGVRADSTVKAVVFRVASPGGSVVASEKIRTEIELLREVKPVIASYGNYAASGGYWISSSCDKIFSDPSTLTGSIGVFSMIPDFSKTAGKVLNVNVTAVGSSRHSDMYSLMRPLDSQEYDYMQKSVNDIYDSFVGIVAEGRGMTVEAVDEIAQGRVWSGKDALETGLVDELGSLADALSYAATAAGNPDLDEWQIAAYPKPLTTLELLMESFGGSSEALAGTPFENVEKAFRRWDWKSSERTFARMPYEMQIQF